MLAPGYDFISDVHGSHGALAHLFNKMGCRQEGNIYVPSEGRQIVFAGDPTDRGRKQKETLKLIWNMTVNGEALITLGNHELNIIKLLTKGLDGKYLRDSNDPFVKKQHRAFFKEINFDSQDHRALIEWFKTIPLFLELEGISLVHACWHQESIDIVKSFLGHNNNALGDDGMDLFMTNKKFRDAVYMILMGPETKLPNGYEYVDAYGNPRTVARHMWALIRDNLSEQLYLNGHELPPHMKPIVDRLSKNRQYGPEKGLLVFGHYAQNGVPKAPKSRVDMICIDFMKYLTAYRFEKGDEKILEERLVYVKK